VNELDWNGEDEAPGDRRVLSPAGEKRRGEILFLLEAAMARKRRRRTAARWAVRAGVPLVLAGLALLGWNPSGEQASPQVSGPAPAPAIGEDRRAGVEVVHDDPRLLERCSLPTAPFDRRVLIGDQELLDLLQAAGRPAGLARVAGNVYLTSNAQAGDAGRGDERS
jgi:hypothetical protein